jgi:FkbM family methyltransferase
MSLIETKGDFYAGKISKQDYIDRMHQIHSHLFEYSDFIRDTDVACIEITDENVVITFRKTGIKMLCDRRDKRIAPMEILNFGNYEKPEFDLVSKLIESDFKIFDIGANIGWYTLNFAKIFDNVEVFSFEPIPNTYRQLKWNVEINNVINVKIFNFGFSNKCGMLQFYYNPEESGNASAANLSGRDDSQKMILQVNRLDDFIVERGGIVDFIKCDVEGAELFVFQGGLKTIMENKPIIFTEMLRKWSAKFNYHPNEIINLLAGAGYRCFVARGMKLVEVSEIDEDTAETNFFFLHSVKHSDKIDLLIDGQPIISSKSIDPTDKDNLGDA